MIEKNKKKKKWLFLIFMFFYLIKKIFNIKKSKKIKEIESNFKDYLHKESKEIKKYTTNKEDFSKFVEDSSNIFKDYFIPHSGNNHTPKILKTKSLAIILFVAILLKFSLVAYLYFVFPNSGKANEAVVSKVLELVNQARKDESVEILKLNPVLSNSALAKANDIISKDYFAHISPDGKRPWDFIDRGQYAYALVGENLAMNFTTAESVHRALMNSPSHKKNIMNAKYRDIGLAMARGEIGGKKTNVLVEIFSVQARQRNTVESEFQKNVQEKENKNKTVEEDRVLSLVKSGINENDENTVKKELEIIPNKAIKKIDNVAQSGIQKNVKKEAKKIIEDSESNENKFKIKKVLTLGAESGNFKNNELSQEIKTKEEINNSNKTIRVIKHPGDQVLAQNVKEKINYQLSLISEQEKSLPSVNTTIENSDNNNFLLSSHLIRISQIAMASILSLIIISLLINIFVRFEIQHKTVLFRTLVAVVFVIALLFVNFHYLENGVVTIYMS